MTILMEDEKKAIDAVNKELLEHAYTQEDIDLWWNTNLINTQTPLEILQDGRARFLIPYVKQLIEARPKNG